MPTQHQIAVRLIELASYWETRAELLRNERPNEAATATIYEEHSACLRQLIAEIDAE